MLHKHSSEVLLLLTVICNGIKSSDTDQNISLANKALQEFFKNFGQIQKVLESKDGFQSNSTSSESEDNSDEPLHDKQNIKKENLLSKQFETTSVRSDQPGTAGIYESHSSGDDDTNSKQITNEATNKAKSSNIHKNKGKKQKTVETTTLKDDTDSVKDSSEYDESEEIPLDIPTKDDNGKSKHKIKESKENNDEKVTSKKPKIFKNLLGKKTRFSIKHFRSNTSKRDSLSLMPLKIEENSRRIKKIIYSETFSPQNIWQEIISRPIQLKKDEDPFITNDRISPNTDKITIVIERGKETEKSDSFERTNDLFVNSERNKIEHLRYGDTCLQVPIKKCNKVIKAVKKRVCHERFKCKSELKSSFIEYGEKACEKEFDYTKTKNDKKKEDDRPFIQPLKNRQKFRQKNEKDSFVDATRDRFFNKRYLRKNSDISRIKSLSNNTSGPTFLRDRFERECQEENRKRCINACENATEKTCSKHSCGNDKNKAFKKSCKEECHNFFHLDNGSDSDSSDSASDTDSDSDKDSD